MRRDPENELSIKQVAIILKRHERTIKRRIDDGTIPAFVDSISGRIYVERSYIDGYLSRKVPYVPASTKHDNPGMSGNPAV